MYIEQSIINMRSLLFKYDECVVYEREANIIYNKKYKCFKQIF